MHDGGSDLRVNEDPTCRFYLWFGALWLSLTGPTVSRLVVFLSSVIYGLYYEHLIGRFSVSSADNLYKQFGPRPGSTECRPDMDQLLDSLIIFQIKKSKKFILKTISR